jgi:uncharacterized protein YuzE
VAQVEMDTESDSMYLHISEKQISHSVELHRDIIILDIAEDDTVVGIELRAVSTWLTKAKESAVELQETGRLVYIAA